MNILLEIIFDIISLFIPSFHNHNDRSITGESDLDRSARRFKITIISIIVILGFVIGAWTYFKK
jgi:hypothetical protein